MKLDLSNCFPNSTAYFGSLELDQSLQGPQNICGFSDFHHVFISRYIRGAFQSEEVNLNVHETSEQSATY